MLIEKLKLNNYRNYESASFDFNKKLNLIVGPNGIGKTNILESLIVVSNTKSFRTSIDQNLIQEEKEYSRIELKTDEGTFKVVINKDNKSLYFNNNLFRKTSDYIGKINCILFKPSDLELFNQSPKERRKILDIELGKINKQYLMSLLQYSELLKDKNKILKEEKINELYLEIINAKMLPEMENIISEREKFFEAINKNISNIYREISNEEKTILIKYQKCAEIDDLKNKIEDTKEKDLIYRYATFGTHHEDYSFYLNDKEINTVASQGQKRMVLISFKLALAKYIKELTGKMPIILLDDVLSELDVKNQNRLLEILPEETQTIITNTDISNIQINKEYKLIDLKEEDYVKHNDKS